MRSEILSDKAMEMAASDTIRIAVVMAVTVLTSPNLANMFMRYFPRLLSMDATTVSECLHDWFTLADAMLHHRT